MSEFHVDAAAVTHTSDFRTDDLLASFAAELTARGVTVRGVVQRNTPDPEGGHAKMELIDLATGESFPISQNLGRDAAACHLDQAGMSAASVVLRRAIGERPDLIIANRFGEQEATGRGFADELLAAMAEGIPVLTAARECWQDAWATFTGGGAAVLPPSLAALRQWFAAIKAA